MNPLKVELRWPNPPFAFPPDVSQWWLRSASEWPHNDQMLQRNRTSASSWRPSFDLSWRGMCWHSVDEHLARSHLDWKSQPLKVLAAVPHQWFFKPCLFWHLLQQHYSVAAERPGAVCVRQGNVTNPKAIKDETSNWMSICPLCNNVTKILTIKLII